MKTDCILEQEFDSDKNGKTLADFSPSSAKKVWWKCSVNPRHCWEARVFSRTQQNAGCPYCKGKKVLEEDAFGSCYPNLLGEWDFVKNEMDPSKTHCRSGKKVWWKCGKEHEWLASITHRTSGGREGKGTGCPYCSNQKASEDNCLITTHPKLLKEWHFAKNIGITPADLVAGSHQKVWWKCEKASDHEWEASLYNRARHNTNCPYCAGRKTSISNCIEVTYPAIAKEWHPTKNKFTPRDVTYASNKKAWFLCVVNPTHEWITKIAARTIKGDKCPFCASSKGEKAIKEWLDKNNKIYQREYKLNDCRNKRPLPFDFAIFNDRNKLLGLIEYQGRHHYEPIEYFGGLKSLLWRQKNDKIKSEYCKNNNVSLLVIPHTDFDKIEELLSDYVKIFY